MKILWNSVAPWIPTGYGQQTGIFTPRIRDLGHDVAISAFAGIEGCITSWNGMRVYPSDISKLNKWALRKYVERESLDGDLRSVQVITLQDVWTWLENAYGGIADYEGLKIASWCPVDHDPVPPGVIRSLRTFDVTPIAMSRFGQQSLQAFDFDPLYVPHGIETNVLVDRRAEADMADIKEAMQIPRDSFLFGMVAANQGQNPPRKAFPQVFEAFALLRQKHDDAFLYMHTDFMGLNQGINLVALAQIYGVADYVKFVASEPYWFGEINHTQMSYLYSMMDCLLCPSYGEGFGIPIVEAQACGTPVIATDWTAMSELVGAGWTVDGDPWYNPGGGSRWKLVSIGDLHDKMEAAYQARDDQELRARARAFAEQYDADLVTETHWKPTLAALEQPREVAPLNRAARRHRAKRDKAVA